LNSSVNERRGRGFFLPMDSMMNILPEHKLLISDVRKNGSAPQHPETGKKCNGPI
jgi:hypothetical protein